MARRHVQATIDAELLDWFDENYSVATKQSFIEGCFRYLRFLVESGAVPTPEVYTALSAKGAAESLTENTETGEKR